MKARTFILLGLVSGLLPAQAQLLPGFIGNPASGSITGSYQEGYLLSGKSSDIWGKADQCVFGYRQVEGDFEFKAKVSELSNSDNWAKAGLMVRTSLQAGAKNICVLLSKSNGIRRQVRALENGSTSSWGYGPASGPVWLSMSRKGNTLAIHLKTSEMDEYTHVYSGTHEMPYSALVGIVHTSHSTSTLGSARFSDLHGFEILAPSIELQPRALSLLVGGYMNNEIVANGTLPLEYQWVFNGSDLIGERSPQINWGPVSRNHDGGFLTCVVSNEAGMLRSLPARITVQDPVAPIIQVQPQSQLLASGETATLEVIAEGPGILAYEWRRNGLALAGETDSRLALPEQSQGNHGDEYRVIVSNGVRPDAVSQPATVRILPGPVKPWVRKQPQDRQVESGDKVQFTMEAIGSTPLTYQWLHDGVELPGTNSPRLEIESVTIDHEGLYECEVVNSQGAVRTRAARLALWKEGTSDARLSFSGEILENMVPVGSNTAVWMDAVVRLWAHSESESPLYTEKHLVSQGRGVPVENGKFHLVLGRSMKPGDLRALISSNPNAYASFEIGREGLLSPLPHRIPLGGTPYALASNTFLFSGNSDPNISRPEAPVGALYHHLSQGTTWRKLESSWQRLD